MKVLVRGYPDYTKAIRIVDAFGYTDKLPVWEVAPWTVIYKATPGNLTDQDYSAALADILGRPRVVVDTFPDDWTPATPLPVDIARVLGAALSKTNPLNVRLSDGTNDVPLPTALDSGAFKIKEQSPLTEIDVGNWPSDYPDSAVATLLGGGLPTALVSDKLKVRASEIETLLAGGLPSALDTDSLKVKQQGSVTVTATDLDIRDLTTTERTPLGSQSQPLQQEATTYELKVKEQSPLSSISVDNFPSDYPDDATLAEVTKATTPTLDTETMTDADTEYSMSVTGTVRKFMLATRDRTAFRLAFVTGKVATPTEPYLSVASNEVYYEDYVKLTNPIFYFASDSAGKVMELLVWT